MRRPRENKSGRVYVSVTISILVVVPVHSRDDQPCDYLNFQASNGADENFCQYQSLWWKCSKHDEESGILTLMRAHRAVFEIIFFFCQGGKCLLTTFRLNTFGKRKEPGKNGAGRRLGILDCFSKRWLPEQNVFVSEHGLLAQHEVRGDKNFKGCPVRNGSGAPSEDDGMFVRLRSNLRFNNLKTTLQIYDILRSLFPQIYDNLRSPFCHLSVTFPC